MTVAGASKAVAELGQPAVDALQKFKVRVRGSLSSSTGYCGAGVSPTCIPHRHKRPLGQPAVGSGPSQSESGAARTPPHMQK